MIPFEIVSFYVKHKKIQIQKLIDLRGLILNILLWNMKKVPTFSRYNVVLMDPFFQTSVTWTSQVFRWLYSDLVIINELLNVWVQTLNEYTKKCAEDVSKSNL